MAKEGVYDEDDDIEKVLSRPRVDSASLLNPHLPIVPRSRLKKGCLVLVLVVSGVISSGSSSRHRPCDILRCLTLSL